MVVSGTDLPGSSAAAINDDRYVAFERDYRRQVKKAYYLREEDFATLQEYNDYLEEVEDIIEKLMNEETREETRRRLGELSRAAKDKTFVNHRRLQADREGMEEAIKREREEKEAREQEREREKREKVETMLRQRQEALAAVATGEVTAAAAQKELRQRDRAASEAAAEKAAAEPERIEYVPAAPSAQQHAQLAQPVDMAAVKEEPKHMEVRTTSPACPRLPPPAWPRLPPPAWPRLPPPPASRPRASVLSTRQRAAADVDQRQAREVRGGPSAPRARARRRRLRLRAVARALPAGGALRRRAALRHGSLTRDWRGPKPVE